MHTHPADGIYYLNADMLRKAGACQSNLGRWVEEFGERDVTITLQMGIDFAENRSLVSSFVIHMLKDFHKVTKVQHRRAYLRWIGSSGTIGECTAAMDLLAVRAKREGRLA